MDLSDLLFAALGSSAWARAAPLGIIQAAAILLVALDRKWRRLTFMVHESSRMPKIVFVRPSLFSKNRMECVGRSEPVRVHR